jgi:hypothetical protein
VQKLIAGTKGVAICNDCVDVCSDIIADTPSRPSSSEEPEPLGPPDLRAFNCPACGHRWALARK